MNDELETRWKQARRPFDGGVLALDDWIDEDALLEAVRRVLALLRASHGSRALFINNDWHDHDGYVNDARATTWGEVVSWTRDVEELRATCSDDWLVHNLLFPDDYAFCLRYWPDWEGRETLDLCGEGSLLERSAEGLREIGVGVNIEASAKAYFDGKWNG